MQKLLLIDGNSLFHRAYHALPPLTDKKGEMANAVFGFSNMIIKAINEVKPTHIACAFDTAAPTFRHIEFEKYKAQRPAPPPDLYPQLPKVKKVLSAFGIKYFEKEGYEADDVLATLTTKALSNVIANTSNKLSVNSVKQSDSGQDSGQALRLRSGRARTGVARMTKREIASSRTPRNDNEVSQVIILSGDRDVLQLVDGNVKVQMPGWNLKETTLYGAREVKEKYGLEPHQMVDYKSLTGDPSDNVPGIAGIGPKTAAQLLSKYHTLENLFKHIKEVPELVYGKLEAGKETALAAKRLVELDRNVDIEFELGKLEFKPDWEQVRREYEELGFKSIMGKLPVSRDQSSGETVQNSQSQSVKLASRSGSKSKKNEDQLKLI